MSAVTSADYDLWYDATAVGADMVVETWISHGPRHGDASFNPQVGDWVFLGDDDEPPLKARVIRREGVRVWAQIALPALATAAAASSDATR